ncbi:duf647 domain-containing protein [Moniliophthora roreri MCA 2997]|nr:duf647 domain-containing protein [Moniliophthora roreri MCA 2997]
MQIFVFLTEAFPIPFRVYLFTISSAFRALCGIAAGGAKMAINLHFATPLEGTGDIADFNAKDASLETVLSLTGMLVGAVILPYITTRFATYAALAVLIVIHLSLNFSAVRGVVLRTLNRQRACLAWAIYRSSEYQSGAHNGTADDVTPSHISKLERIFHRPSRLVDLSGKIVGQCKIGSSLALVSLNGQTSGSLEKVLDILRKEQYVLWFDAACLSTLGSSPTVVGKPRIHIFLKEGYTPRDQLKAWVHATELALMKNKTRRRTPASSGTQTAEELIANSYRVVDEIYPNFLQAMYQKGWVPTNDENLELVATLLPGPPRTVIVGIH